MDLSIRQEAVLSTQVLHAYFVSAMRKLGLEAHVARQRVMQFGRFERIQPTLAMLLAAMDLQQNHSLSFWVLISNKAPHALAAPPPSP